MNMQVLAPSRKAPRPGDVFTFRMPDGLYRFGRVIRTDAVVGGYDKAILIYIYRVTADAPTPVPALSRDDLLVPPIGVTREPWTQGYFQTVQHAPLTPGDVLPVHCFWSEAFKCYYDADDNRLPQRVEPCGFNALSFASGVDNDVSDALGIPQAEDSETADQELQIEKEHLSKLVSEARELPIRKTPAMQGLLSRLLSELEALGGKHDELYDSEVRDVRADAILEGFIYAKEDYQLPKNFAMSSSRANAAVRKLYFSGARRGAPGGIELARATPAGVRRHGGPIARRRDVRRVFRIVPVTPC